MHTLNYLKTHKFENSAFPAPCLHFVKQFCSNPFHASLPLVSLSSPEGLLGVSNTGFKIIVFTFIQIVWNLALLKFMNDAITGNSILSPKCPFI